MATLVQSANTADSSPPSVAYASNVAANNIGVVVAKTDSASGQLSSFADTLSSTWALVRRVQVASTGAWLEVWCTVFGSGGANTVTPTPGSQARLWIGEINGLGAGALVDSSNGAQGTSASADSGSISPSGATFLIGALGLSGYPTITVTAGSGWTLDYNGANKYGAEWRNQAAGGTFNGTFTLPESNDWAAIVVAFKAAGGAPALFPTGQGWT
jgi:hypothetical protein